MVVTLIAIVIDFAEKVNRFMNKDLSFFQVIQDYYLHFIPWINGLMWPLCSLISVIFFTSRMARDSEVISILNAGVSYKRFLVPYLVSASIISGAMWIGINYIIPNSIRAKSEFESQFKIKTREKTRSSDTHFFISPESKVFVRYYRKKDTTIQGFRLENFNQEGRLNKLITAEKVSFKEEPHEWTLKDYSIRTFDGMNETLLVADGETMDTSLNFRPKDFILHTQQMQIMTTRDLKNYISMEQDKGLDNTKKYYIELYRRSADPFTIFILTLIGVSVASRKVRGGTGIQLAIGVVIGSVFVLLSKFSVTFAHNLSLSAQLGVWTPNIIFSVIAMILVMKAQK